MPTPAMDDQSGVLAIGPAYWDRLAKALASPAHAAVLAPAPGLVLVEATCEGIALAALVHPETHIVQRAAYRGTLTLVQRGLFEMLCEIIAGRSVLECSDHAAIALEHALRDPARPRPVPGIIMPENADPAFRLPAALVRALAHEYWNTTGLTGSRDENFFDPPPSPAWRALSREERLQKVREALADICAALPLPATAVTNVSVEGVTRVFLDLAADISRGAKGALLMRIEAALKARVEATLHVYTVERKDLNKIRRLATPQSESPATTASEGGHS